MRLSISETARTMGVSVRTLHYYDEIGLLAPSELTEAGYRYYGDEALARLQQILFFRELSFSLKEIADMLAHPDYDRQQVLREHRALLLLRKKEIEEMIHMVDRTLEGKSIEPGKASELEETKRRYAEEARTRWGGTPAYTESQKKERDRTLGQQAAVEAEASEVFAAFAAVRGEDPAGPAAQALVKRWQAHITAHHYRCTKEILAGLGQMYVGDPRFAENLDRFGAGTAQFMSAAIAAYCK